MRLRKAKAMPARLAAGRRRFEQWRRIRKGRSRIPESLWLTAVRLAGAYGLCRTAQTLGLDYYALKRRVALSGRGPRVATAEPGSSAGGKSARSKTAPQNSDTQPIAPTFVELVPAQHAYLTECTVELEHPQGTKMRIHLTGRQGQELVTALSRFVLGAES